MPAAQYHGVNHNILRAVLRVESSLNPNTIARNDNGSVDVGIAGINSIHFKDLATFGISPTHLMDACVGTFVAAWNIRKHIAADGNTMEAIARYNSKTPYFNRRYQILLHNELVRSGVVDGSILAVPPLRPGVSSHAPGTRKTASGRQDVAATTPAEAESIIVFDR